MTQIHAATLKVIQGGRITIPTEVRELEHIQEGDYVKVTIEKIERIERKPDQTADKNLIKPLTKT